MLYTVLQLFFLEFLTDCVLLTGAPVTATTTAAVVSQSPQLYNQQTNSPDSPVSTKCPLFQTLDSLPG